MRGAANFYAPISYLLNLACAEMMAHYRLPHCGTSGSGMGWGADLIAAGNQWVNHLTSCLGKIGLAPFVGDNLGSKAFSPAVVVYANEVIAQARRIAKGFRLEVGELALDDIASVGPGGNYLTADSTLQRFRSAYFSSEVFPNLTLEEWQAQESPQAVERLRAYTGRLIARLAPPEDHDDLMSRGEAYITGRC